MTLFYLSFCDRTKPTGQHFLGATVVRAEDSKAAFERAIALGLNPGGEVAIVELPADNADALPPDTRKYFEAFVPRDVVLGEPYQTVGAGGVQPDASVCQDHNPGPV